MTQKLLFLALSLFSMLTYAWCESDADCPEGYYCSTHSVYVGNYCSKRSTWPSSKLGHANHGMLLHGTNEIFASHIVNKVPHNWQVILQVNFSDDVKKVYLEQAKAHPNDNLIWVLNHLDLAQIQSVESINGDIIRVDSQGKKTQLIEDIILEKSAFKVVYLKELPLSLEPDTFDTRSMRGEQPHCAFYPELCISVEGQKNCQGVGQYCGSSENCCPGLECVPSGSVFIGAHKCHVPIHE